MLPNLVPRRILQFCHFPVGEAMSAATSGGSTEGRGARRILPIAACSGSRTHRHATSASSGRADSRWPFRWTRQNPKYRVPAKHRAELRLEETLGNYSKLGEKSWFFSFFLVCIERATKERSDNFDHRIVRFPLWTGTNKSSKQIETRRKRDDFSYACAITSAKRNRQSPRPRITNKRKK